VACGCCSSCTVGWLLPDALGEGGAHLTVGCMLEILGLEAGRPAAGAASEALAVARCGAEGRACTATHR